MNLNNSQITSFKYDTKPIDLEIISKLTTFAFNNELYKLPLSEFELQIKVELKYQGVNCELFDVLFKPDNNGFCIFLYILSENKHPLFSSIIDKYKDELSTFLPNEWEFMLWVKHNKCHDSFTEFYGKEAIDKLVDLKQNVLFYSSDHFYHNFLLNKLDSFYEIENMKKFNYKITRPVIHLLNFFNVDPDGFKNFMMDNKLNNSLEYTKDSFKFTDLMCKHYGVGSLNHYINLHLPNGKEFDVLASKWGADKASQVISDFINFQNEYILSFNDAENYTFKFPAVELKSLIELGVKFNNCGIALAFGVKDKSDFLSYFIINNIITKDDLLKNMEDKELKIKAEHDMLENSLEKKTIITTKRSKL
jgi:hypothetical protein